MKTLPVRHLTPQKEIVTAVSASEATQIVAAEPDPSAPVQVMRCGDGDGDGDGDCDGDQVSTL